MTLDDLLSLISLAAFLGLQALGVALIAYSLSEEPVSNPESYPSYGTGEPNDPQRFSYK